MPVHHYESYLKESGLLDNPFAPTPELVKRFGENALSLEEFYEVFDFAFRRMSVVLNESFEGSPFYSRFRERDTILKLDDEEIRRFFHDNDLKKKGRYNLFSVRFSPAPTGPTRETLAEEEFYSTLRIESPVKKADWGPAPHMVKRRIEYEMRLGFWLFLYESYTGPRNSNLLELSKSDFLAANTNYLLRNLWHNFIHVVYHKWTSHSYHNFRGESRMYADFEADSYSYILLVHSYGINPKTDGVISKEEREEIKQIFDANASNKVFETRNNNRRPENRELMFPDPETPAEYLESEWRFRRSLSNQLMRMLILEGLTPSSIGVYPFGPLSNDRKMWRSSNQIIASINGVKVFGEVPRNSFFYHAEKNTEHFEHICRSLVNQYHNELKKDEVLRDNAINSLELLMRRLL